MQVPRDVHSAEPPAHTANWQAEPAKPSSHDVHTPFEHVPWPEQFPEQPNVGGDGDTPASGARDAVLVRDGVGGTVPDG